MTTSPFTYREAAQKDLPILTQLLYQLFSIEEDFSFDAEKQQTGLALLLASPQAAIFVAEQRKTVIGMCTGQLLVSTAEGASGLIIEDVVIDKAWRGNGIGPRLLHCIEQWGATFGANRLQLLADKNNSPALSFYNRQGWQKTQLICLRKYRTS